MFMGSWKDAMRRGYILFRRGLNGNNDSWFERLSTLKETGRRIQREGVVRLSEKHL